MTTTVERVVTVLNPQGIHMRPADQLSRTAGQFESHIEIEKDGQSIDCKSIMSLLTLGAGQGTRLHIRASGVDAEQAVEVLSELFDRGFDESGSEVTEPSS